MQLILSSMFPWNTTYCNEAGQSLYKAEGPGWYLFGSKIKLSRAVPSSLANKGDSTLGGSRSKIKGDVVDNAFEPVGDIEYHHFKDSRIKYGGVDQSVSDFFKKTGSGYYGRHRTFIGPDGREYVWKMNADACQLFLNDPSETPVATFHRKHWGVFHPKSPGSLEILPPGEHMVELILITFIYLEKLRRDRESSSGGSF